MDHKEMCFNYVEERKDQDDDGRWWIIIPETGERIAGPYESEAILDKLLWEMAMVHAHERYMP